MTAVSASRQLTLDFDPGLSERHASLADCIRECVYTYRRGMKALAADMDLSQSDLSRKVSGNPEDSRRFTIDDLERYLVATGDLRPIFFLVERFAENHDSKQRRALAELAALAPQVAAFMRLVKEPI